MNSNVITLNRMAENPYKPTANMTEGTAESAAKISLGQYVAGLLIALLCGVVAAPVAFALMWGLGESRNGGALLLIVPIGVFVASFGSSRLLNRFWPVACILICVPTFLVIGGTTLNNNFSMATTVPLLAVFIPSIMGGVASILRGR